MIKVLHTIDTTGPGGAETVFINLLRGMDGRRFESHAAIAGPGWVHDTLLKSHIVPAFVPSKGRFSLLYLWALVRLVRHHGIDIIHSHLLGSNIYCSLAGLICRVPVISTFHGFVDTAEKERLLKLKIQSVNLGSRAIVFVSERLREHYVSRLGISSKKSITIYNGVDTTTFFPQKDDRIRKALGLDKEHILIGALGNIRPAKGYEYLLHAARLVHDAHPRCRFLIAGQGSGSLFEKLLEVRKELDLEGLLFFTGFRSDTAMLLNNLDIFVLPSVSEGFSISTLEAMACAVPVVATRSGGPEEILQDGVNGLMVQPANAQALAAAVSRLVGDDGLCRKLKNNALSTLDIKFSQEVMFRKYDDLINLILAKSK
jgi:glycosyltransferase involved in cell wall biosynthesis